MFLSNECYTRNNTKIYIVFLLFYKKLKLKFEILHSFKKYMDGSTPDIGLLFMKTHGKLFLSAPPLNTIKEANLDDFYEVIKRENPTLYHRLMKKKTQIGYGEKTRADDMDISMHIDISDDEEEDFAVFKESQESDGSFDNLDNDGHKNTKNFYDGKSNKDLEEFSNKNINNYIIVDDEEEKEKLIKKESSNCDENEFNNNKEQKNSNENPQEEVKSENKIKLENQEEHSANKNENYNLDKKNSINNIKDIQNDGISTYINKINDNEQKLIISDNFSFSGEDEVASVSKQKNISTNNNNNFNNNKFDDRKTQKAYSPDKNTRASTDKNYISKLYSEKGNSLKIFKINNKKKSAPSQNKKFLVKSGNYANSKSQAGKENRKNTK